MSSADSEKKRGTKNQDSAKTRTNDTEQEIHSWIVWCRHRHDGSSEHIGVREIIRFIPAFVADGVFDTCSRQCQKREAFMSVEKRQKSVSGPSNENPRYFITRRVVV